MATDQEREEMYQKVHIFETEDGLDLLNDCLQCLLDNPNSEEEDGDYSDDGLWGLAKKNFDMDEQNFEIFCQQLPDDLKQESERVLTKFKVVRTKMEQYDRQLSA